MKHLISVLLFTLLGYTAMAQASSLTVQNNTGCWVYYRIHGASICSSSSNIGSTVIAVAPGAVVNYPNSASIPGFPPGPLYFLNFALVYDKPVACTPSAPWRIGEPCTGMNPTATYNVFRPDCTLCGPSITAQWISGGPGGNATLIFF